MEISINTRQAYSEIDAFLGILSEEKRNEIPQKLITLFKKEKDQSYVKEIDINAPLKNQNLKEETLDIIAFLNLQYWCKDETEKERLMKIYTRNEQKYQEELREKYNPDNLFMKKTVKEPKQEETVQNNVSMIEYKESIIIKIINRIKEFFRIK